MNTSLDRHVLEHAHAQEMSPYERELRTLQTSDELGPLALREVMPHPRQLDTSEKHHATQVPMSEQDVRYVEEYAMQAKNTADNMTRRALEDSPVEPQALALRIELLAVYYALRKEHDASKSITVAHELTQAAAQLRSE